MGDEMWSIIPENAITGTSRIKIKIILTNMFHPSFTYSFMSSRYDNLPFNVIIDNIDLKNNLQKYLLC